jgi:hypothetical protein
MTIFIAKRNLIYIVSKGFKKMRLFQSSVHPMPYLLVQFSGWDLPPAFTYNYIYAGGKSQPKIELANNNIIK